MSVASPAPGEWCGACPVAETPGAGFAASEGAFASWLARRGTRQAAPYLSPHPPPPRLLRRRQRTRGDAGGSTKRPVERGADCGERNGSERAQVASVAEGKPPRGRVHLLR